MPLPGAPAWEWLGMNHKTLVMSASIPEAAEGTG